MCYLCGKGVYWHIFHITHKQLWLFLLKGTVVMMMANLGKTLGGKEWSGYGLVPSTRHPGPASRPRLDLHSGCILGWWSWTRLSSWQIWQELQMRGDNEQGSTAEGRDGRGAHGGITQRFHGMHLPVHHVHLENNNSRKASKEVHIILVTFERTCTSLLGNVCLPSIRHLLEAFSFATQLQVHLPIPSHPLSLSLSSPLSLPSAPHKITLVSTNLEAEPNPVTAYLMLLSIFCQKNISGHKVLCLFPEARFNDITWMTTTL